MLPVEIMCLAEWESSEQNVLKFILHNKFLTFLFY